MTNNPLVIGLKSARANLIPGIILQCATFTLLFAYYKHPPTQNFLAQVETWQAQYGVLFSLLSYLTFCGLVPYLFCMLIPSLRPKDPLRALLFAIFFWSILGLALPQFYRLQTWMYGSAANFKTLALKIVTDQCGYTALFASPAIALSHLWRDRGYQWQKIAPHLTKGWYRRLVLPNLVVNWIIWIPSLCVVYSLPTPLQSHIAGLISGFFALMSLQIAKHTSTS